MTAATFVGREDALGKLSRALSAAAAGTGCLALVYGEAGIGKTRLCRQLHDGHWRNSAAKALERQLAALAQARPVTT